MEQQKSWPTEVVLSIVTGFLVAEFSEVHRAMEWLAGEPVWTHQLPRIAREAKPGILADHPAIEEACKEAEAGKIDKSNWQAWQSRWRERYGATLLLRRMTADQHERIDPVSELAEKVAPDNVVVVGTDGGPA